VRRIQWLGILLLIIIFFLLGIYAGSHVRQRQNGSELSPPADPPAEESEPEAEESPAVPDIRTATIVSAGAIYPHSPQLDQAYLGDGRYDFTPSFEVIKPLVEAADLAVVTLETAQAGPEMGGYSAYPTFNSPLAVSEALKWAGFDLFNAANNHIMDRGYEGLMVTIDNVRALGIDLIGIHKSWEERNTPYIRDINGIKVGFISYTYNTNGFLPPEGHEYAINYIPEFYTIEPLISDIKAARAAGADLVALYLHWGLEYEHEPTARQKEMAVELARAGADLIIGTHSHVLQPIDLISVPLADGTTHKAVVIYALGNFCTNQHLTEGVPTDLTRYGILAQIDLAKDMHSGEAWIEDVNYVVNLCQINWRHRVIPVPQILAEPPEKYHHSAERVETIKAQYDAILEIMERYDFTARKADFLKR
jgi:poly-gamma-glutamate synthesis protein (capsule biosynthesis protein)